jgi:hypothetical protein
MSQAFLPTGSQFKIGDAHSGETFTAVAEVNRISGLGWSRDFADTTSLDTTGGYQTMLPKLRKGDQITIDMNWTVANWDKFRDIFESEDEETDAMDYQVVLKAGATTKYTWEFNAFIGSVKVGDITPDEKLSMTVTLQVTGPPTETSGA